MVISICFFRRIQRLQMLLVLIDKDIERVSRQRVPTLRIVGLQIFSKRVYASKDGVNTTIGIAGSGVSLSPENVLHRWL